MKWIDTVSSKTVNALIARGVNSVVGQTLAKQFTVGALQQLSRGKLLELGLTEGEANSLLDAERPPIDQRTVFALTNSCRGTCCVCRKPNEPFIIHHITPWAKSRSHDITNLVVLCLNCHSEAHTTRAIAQNLTPARIRYDKAEWELKVQQKDAESLITPRFDSGLTSAMWDYFNRSRLLHVASNLEIDLAEIADYGCLGLAQVILNGKERSAAIARAEPYLDSPYLYDAIGHPISNGLYNFFRDLLHIIVRRRPPTVITTCWSRTALKSFGRVGNILAYTGAYRFKRQSNLRCGPGQNRMGYVRRRGIELLFTIDGWEATSSSSHHNHLTGIWICTAILLVRSVTIRKRLLSVETTCLAIGTGFEGHKDYTPDIALANRQESVEYEDAEYERLLRSKHTRDA